MNLVEKIKSNKAKISVVGLGYVGLPIALEFAKQCAVIGFDIKPDRIELMKNNIDPSEELSASDFENTNIEFTCNPDDLAEATFHIVAVPTPIDSHNLPDLSPLIAATKTVARILKKGDYVVYESTVYPGATEEDCLPILEEISGLKLGADFKIGFSPERINPGDKVNTLTSIVKVVSGSDAEALDIIAKVYEMIITAGVHRASNIKVAEAAKIIENTQRDINIAFMNELSVLFNKMGINTFEVLEAAGTKWNFLNFYPGLVGGHCIGVDPYYLAFKAKEFHYHPQIINAGRSINDSMGFYLANQVVKKLIAADKNISQCKVLVLGATFKEDVSDIRNSKVADVIKELQSFRLKVEVSDPHANSDELKHEYGFRLVNQIGDDYDAVIVAVSHNEYKSFDEDYFSSLLNERGILIDIKGTYRNIIKEIEYFSL